MSYTLFEPGAVDEERQTSNEFVSMAISLKRIADVLENFTVERVGDCLFAGSEKPPAVWEDVYDIPDKQLNYQIRDLRNGVKRRLFGLSAEAVEKRLAELEAELDRRQDPSR